MARGETKEFAGTQRFAIVRRLGAGGMGVVYEAFDRERGAAVALKTLKTWSADALLRFKNEFRALQDLQHPNLVALGELLEEAGQLFFTMELVRGVTFLAWLRPSPLLATKGLFASDSSSPSPPASSDSGSDTHSADLPRTDAQATGPATSLASPERRATPFAVDEARLRAALTQLCLGLHALHSGQKVHRDIKPGNVLVTPEGRVVILDFGLVTGAPGHESYPDEHLVGTASYMAPEQATGAPVGPAADWYAVGVVLYQALTGRLPLIASPESVVIMKQAIEPTPPRLIVPEVPVDLDQLCVELLRIDPERRPTGREILRRLRAEEDQLATVLTGQAQHFVGRRNELAALRAGFDETRGGAGLTLFVDGESGVGKSVLTREFTDLLAASETGAVIFSARCYERESVPYKAVDGIVDALSRWLTTVEAAEVTRLLPVGGGLIGQVFPVMRRVAQVAQAPRQRLDLLDPQELRTRVFATLRDLFGRLAARRPLVLVIDDLQWADADSLALLAELMRPPHAPSLLLLATVREASEYGPGVASPEHLAAAIPGASRHLRVASLSRDDAETLVHLLMREAGAGADGGGDAGRAFNAGAIAVESGGHPLFIDELVRCKLTLGDQPGPLRLEEALWARIARLDGAPRTLLELVAVAGAPLLQETAAHAAGVAFGDFAGQVSVLRSSHLIRTNGARRSDAVETYHDRVRDAVLEHLSDGDRGGWHGKLALALEASGRADPEALATHWRGAGQLDKASEYAVRAADDAALALAFDRAARLYQLALELKATGAGGGAAVDEARLRAKLGDALANAGRGAEAADAYLAAVALAGAGEALDLQRRAADQLLRSGHIDRGLAVLRTVLAAVGTRLPETPNGALFSLLFRRARARLRGLGFVERSAGEVTASALGRIDTYWSVSGGLAIVDTIRGADFQTRGLLLALDAGEPYRIARALDVEAGFSAAAGGPAKARTERLLAAAGALVEKLKEPQALGVHAASSGLAAFLEGRWQDARELLDQGAEIFLHRCTGVAWELHTAQLYAMISLYYSGGLDELQRRFPLRLREAQERGNLYAATTLRTALCNAALLAADEHARARDELHDSMQRWSRQGFHLQHYWNLMTENQLDLYTGQCDAAHQRIVEQWPALRRSLLLRIQVVRVEALQLRARSALACAGQKRDDQPRLLAAAERDAGKIAGENMAWSAPLAQLLRAGVAAARGDQALSIRRLTDAAAGFDAAGMALYATAARLRHAALTGGDEGTALRARADAWLRAERVKNPAALIQMLAPGFD